MTDWEERACQVRAGLEELQQSAPMDVSMYLYQAREDVQYALRRYRENRKETDG
jgi:hypothetical protein